MKLVSLNVALFEKNNDALLDFLATEQPDILCLQEVTKRLDEHAIPDYISKEAIDRATPQLNYGFFAPIWALSSFEQTQFHGKEHFSFELGGMAEFGNYVKSAFPICKAENIFVQNHFSYVTDWSHWPKEDYRAFIVADLQLPETKVRIITYHGIWSRDKQGTPLTKQACERIREIATAVAYPCIICGDFNLFPDTESISVLSDTFTSLVDSYNIDTTRPASNELHHQQRNVVDYIFVSHGIHTVDFSVPNIEVSDHLPLILEFEVR